MYTTGSKYALWACIALLGILLLTTGCGLKVWPSPLAQEDEFSWKEVSFSFSDTCLTIRATVEGAYDNLARVDLEWAPGDEDCPSCPFQARETRSFAMSDPEITRQGQTLTLLFCQLPPHTGFRWRIVGHNVHASLQPVASHVMYVGEDE
ncbi:hypothetical protein [Desulfoplanes formicivorans]|uniref:Lipoprotein n=1 Tax=Desulfoplanes formicivorans TaxID=1592317 RepID=A0A194AIV7_9BACT|nr:hypothetical protein [Desulfoplanes formicivorans]GAU09263.1 hypothetical protein DPF_1985 [Desulfoplanes formicivorans]